MVKNSTMIVEYRISYSASPYDQVFQREGKMWNDVPVLAQTGLFTWTRRFFWTV